MIASVILPTYNRMPVLKDCISHLMNQTAKDFEVILIDDSSKDGTSSFIRKLDYPRLNYIHFNKQRGPYHARNVGVTEARGDIIIFIDSDVVVYPDFIEDHISIHKRKKNIVLQGMVKHVDSISDISIDRFYLPNALCIKTFITQNVSVRKKWLDKIGGFDEFGPRMGYKDIDMGLRLRTLGLRWVYGIRRCKAFHLDGLTSEESLKSTFNKWKNQGASAYCFVKKWGNKGERIARTKKAIFFSNLLSTNRWIEKDSVAKMMIESKNHSGIVWTIMKGITRYHYRKKGIEEAKENEGIGYSSKL